LLCPRALGVGYDTIEALLRGTLSTHDTLWLIAVKWTIWAAFLGSGTSGGVVAPVLMVGAGVGTLLAHALPACGVGFWPVVVMGATLGAAMGSPMTGVVFAAEVTDDFQVMLPLLVAAAFAHGFTVLVMRRSILTEKIARRGFHLTREYAIDSLDVLFVRDVMERLESIDDAEGPSTYPDELLSTAVRRMAETGHTRLRVLARDNTRVPIGAVTLAHTLVARQRHLEEEQRRERMLSVRDLIVFAPPRRNRTPKPVSTAASPEES
jgi:hypothetical protein